MRVFSYIVSKDFGHAPNPFHGVCILACCKPAVRRSTEPCLDPGPLGSGGRQTAEGSS